MSNKVRIWKTETSIPTVHRITPVTCGNISIKLTEVENAETGAINRVIELPETIRTADLPELLAALAEIAETDFAKAPQYEPGNKQPARMIDLNVLEAVVNVLRDAPVGVVTSSERNASWQRRRAALIAKITTKEQTDANDH